jgi:hypothetical protein
MSMTDFLPVNQAGIGFNNKTPYCLIYLHKLFPPDAG